MLYNNDGKRKDRLSGSPSSLSITHKDIGGQRKIDNKKRHPG
jgi:hypothetical protein